MSVQIVLEIGRDEILIKLAGRRRKLIHIAAVSLQRPRGLMVIEFSVRRLVPQVPPCPQMNINHHLYYWQHFSSICCGVGRQCGTLSWPCGVGQGDVVLCPRLASSFIVSLLCVALTMYAGKVSEAQIN